MVTTAHSSIPDIFSDGVNGLAVEKSSAGSYRTAIYQASLTAIVDGARIGAPGSR